MIPIDLIKDFFPPNLYNNLEFRKLMLKEYVQCQILEFLSHSKYISKLSFIGGTSLRLIKQVDRFSEDLDFDCKGISREEFLSMTDDVIRYLVNLGYHVEPKEREHDALVAFRRSLYFPQLLFSLHLSDYKNARFLIKIEMQDQQFSYRTVPTFVRNCGFYFPVPVPPDDILCSMKISALLNRSKGRDFYDVLFLLSRSNPNYEYLTAKHGIHNSTELQEALAALLASTNLEVKQRDVQHLLFDPQKSHMITNFSSFINDYFTMDGTV